MSTNQQIKLGQQLVNFDTDSKPIGIDNRCSACILHDIKDFIGNLRQSNRTIKGFGGIRHNSNIMTAPSNGNGPMMKVRCTSTSYQIHIMCQMAKYDY